MKPAFFLFLSAAVVLSAKEVSITLPPETATLKPGKGVELAQGQCVMCHSVDYISTQPPMPRKFWEATVKKMKEKFGAPTPDDQMAALADYLTAAYGLADDAR
jgi:sulfite dehydrogenase (cytochrome) subunit B